ncbi:MAG: ribokinase [Firmicutes bacterium]|nr:ribokinase [Bacillota bacterium]
MAVVVLGSINLDLIARIKRVPKPGETGLAETMTTSPGGKGANQALAARRMGAETTLLGMVGEDAFAVQALKYLRQDGVDLSRIEVSRERSTGLAMIVVEDSGQNAITVVPGANGAVGQDVLAGLSALLSARDILVLQLEIPFDVVEEAIRIAHQVRARILLDPAPAVERLPKSFYRVDVIMPNQFEAETILGAQITDVRSAKAAARQLRSRGAEVAIVKLGEMGVVWATGRGLFYLPGETVAAIDTVGAGDAFAGALAARLDAGEPLAEAIRVANRAAALSTTKRGAQPSFALWEEVRQSQPQA